MNRHFGARLLRAILLLAGCGAAFQGAVLAGQPAPTPTVTSVTPNSGLTTGGTPVTIAGTNFAAGATVTFGAGAATNVVVTSDTQITANTPPRATAGAADVTVTNPSTDRKSVV